LVRDDPRDAAAGSAQLVPGRDGDLILYDVCARAYLDALILVRRGLEGAGADPLVANVLTQRWEDIEQRGDDAGENYSAAGHDTPPRRARGKGLMALELRGATTVALLGGGFGLLPDGNKPIAIRTLDLDHERRIKLGVDHLIPLG